MMDLEKTQLWDDFLAAWPPERVREMSVEEYTNPDKEDAFIYWIETRLEKLGSIWGGSAFKFGIYYRDNKEQKEAGRGRIWGDTYAWLSSYGKTEAEAFGTIRTRLIDILDAVQNGNLDRIDEVDFAPVVKWKVAFLYQNRENPIIFPILKKEALFYHYRAIDPTAKMRLTPYSVMYTTLLERNRNLGDIFDIATALWNEFNTHRNRKPRAWAVPLSWTMDAAQCVQLCGKTRIEPEDVDAGLNKILSDVELSEGDLLALLIEGDVRAVGTLTNAEPGEYSWNQTPVDFPSGLLVIPTSEVRELDAAEQEEIWSHVPIADAPPSTGPKYWKIAPGPRACGWSDWHKEGIASIGWPELGDLAGISRDDFEKRREACANKFPGYKKRGMVQVWKFRDIKPGDRIIANNGQYVVVGIGTVTEGYRYSPGWHFVDGEDYAHQVKVQWNDMGPRKVNKPGWLNTLKELPESEFEEISETQISNDIDDAGAKPVEMGVPSPAAPCIPRSIILYGPPGTGKTYSTIRRALELILGPKSIEGLPDETLVKIFREKQAQGQVEFVTFHQAYGYEEFVEGIRPVFGNHEGSEVCYELHDGIFKRIALRAAAEGLIARDEVPDFDTLWSLLLNNIGEEETRVVTSISGKPYILRTSGRGSLHIYPCELGGDGSVMKVDEDSWQIASRKYTQMLWNHRNELGPEPKDIDTTKTSQLFAREFKTSGGHHYAAIWIAYRELLNLSRSVSGRKQGLIASTELVQQALDRPSAGGASFSFSSAMPQYVLIVDEINRGNISKILGELITLLEPDKRLGMPSELKLPLSYSPEHRFAVPPNLHVIGTMNTADRSIALMDVALRRRFTFEELMPDSGVIAKVLGKEVADRFLIDLVIDIFDTMNHRIRFVYDADHQLGHAYFLGVRTLDDLRRVFVNRIIPLLQEYFYGAWDKICMILGSPYTDEGRPARGGSATKDGAYLAPIITAKVFDEETTLGFDHSDYENRIDYGITSAFATGNSGNDILLSYFLGVLPERKYADYKAKYEVKE
jgi:5-methylcytosine-specific restriction endonuclease McrBC GTP-binding regulatory subunit McrB